MTASRYLSIFLMLTAGGGLAATTTAPATDSHPAPSAVQSPTEATPATATATNELLLPANTRVELEVVDMVSSATAKPGDYFKLKVAWPVRVGDAVLIPTGTPVVGQVIHASKKAMGGKAGELIVSARHIEFAGRQIKLRSNFGAAGSDRTSQSLITSQFVGVFGLLVKGKDMVLPAGTALSAKLANDTVLPPAPEQAPLVLPLPVPPATPPQPNQD